MDKDFYSSYCNCIIYHVIWFNEIHRREFFSKIDKGEFLVQIELPKDASVEKTNFMTQKAEDYLSKSQKL